MHSIANSVPNKPNFGRCWLELDIAYQVLQLLALTEFVQMKSSGSEQKSLVFILAKTPKVGITISSIARSF